MRLVLTDQILATAAAHLDEIADTNLLKMEISSYFAKLASITLFSEMEAELKKIVADRLSIVGDVKLQTFILSTNEGMLKRMKRGELRDTVKLFGADAHSSFLNLVSEADYSRFQSVVLSRHTTAHGTGGDSTVSEIVQAVDIAKRILDAVALSIAKVSPTAPPT